MQLTKEITKVIDNFLHEQLLEITEKYHCDFLGYDDGCGLIDIGWEKVYPDYTTMHAFLAEVNQVFS